MPSPASSNIAAATSLELEILPSPKKKSKSEIAMEELLGKGKSSSGESTCKVESHTEKNQRINKEIQQLSNEAPIGLTEDMLMWWKENEKQYPLVRNLAARVLAAPPTSVPSEQIFSKAGLIVSKKRAALKPAIVDTLLFLSKNNM
ncbi:zinc finger BED domain-containing protein 1-like [Dendronephthya gigantea]|uniref:zinc finger BED domain-containing protein 1-like n=1 Tax=Dendronephthya gigantea TaxID=151771 RepID=UPI00106C9954|nr:zinc finger BED domain-containing protein 1-like [Dendronephthya gigantea]